MNRNDYDGQADDILMGLHTHLTMKPDDEDWRVKSLSLARGRLHQLNAQALEDGLEQAAQTLG